MWLWVIVIQHPDGTISLFHLPPDMDPVPAEVFDRAKAEVGVPEEWFDAGWMVSLTMGEPHPTLLARATLYDWSGGVPE